MADCGRDAAAALIAKGALQHVRSYLASGYTGAADVNNGANSPSSSYSSYSAANVAAMLPSMGAMGRVIWGGDDNSNNGGGGAGGFKGTGLGQRLPGEMGDSSTYTEEENGRVAQSALTALAGLAPALDFSQQDQHGPLTPLLLRCVEVDASVSVVEAAAKAVHAMLTLGKGGDPRVALFRAGRSGGEEVSTRQMLLQPLLSGLARALAAPRAFSPLTGPGSGPGAGPGPGPGPGGVFGGVLGAVSTSDQREESARLEAMRAAILGAMAAMCERSPTNCLLLGALPGTVADISRIAEKANETRLRVLAAELLCEIARGGGLRLATQTVDAGAARAACQLLEDGTTDRTAIAACRLMESLAVGEDNTVAVACCKPRALLPLLPLLGPQATHDAREAAASLVAQLSASARGRTTHPAHFNAATFSRPDTPFQRRLSHNPTYMPAV